MGNHLLVQNPLLQTSGSDLQLSPLGLQAHQRFGLSLEQILHQSQLRVQDMQELLERQEISVVSTLKEGGKSSSKCLYFVTSHL